MAVTFTIKKQIATKDDAFDAVNNLQSDLITVMTQLTQAVSSQMQLITNVSLNSTTASLVAHNLGYECRGFVVVNKTASFDVYRDGAATNPDPLRYIMLRTSAGTQTVSLLVF
jgi:hypothetical protein